MAEPSRSQRLTRVIAFEIDRILRHLAERRDFLVQTWSRHRAREPFLDTLFSRYRTLDMGDLALLDDEVIMAIEPFYELLGEMVMYVRYTEDMPVTLADAWDLHVEELTARGAHALVVIGLDLPPSPRLQLVE